MNRIFYIIIVLCGFILASCKTIDVNTSPQKDQLALFVFILGSERPKIIVTLEDSILFEKKFKTDKAPQLERIDGQMHLLNIDKMLVHQKKISFLVGQRDTSIVYTNLDIDSVGIIYQFYEDEKFHIFDNFDHKRWLIY